MQQEYDSLCAIYTLSSLQDCNKCQFDKIRAAASERRGSALSSRMRLSQGEDVTVME